MKTLIFILFGTLFSHFAYTQDEIRKSDEENRSFTLAMKSREKAEKVLRLFDTIHAPKLLYSIDDKHYLVIIKNDGSFSEYYVKMTSKNNISDSLLLDNIEGKSGLLKRAFDLENYSSELIFDNRGIISAKKYFVVIDKNGKRYGECSVLSLPFVHIDDELNMYCAKRLAEIVYGFELNWEKVNH